MLTKGAKMIAALISEFGGWIVAAVLALAGIVGVYFKGRSSGKTEAVVERQVVIEKQSNEAKKEVQNVETKVDALGDNAVRDLARSKWVRK